MKMELIRRFWKDEKGMGMLEIILIIAVIVVIAVAFRKWIMKWVSGLFQEADRQILQYKVEKSPELEPTITP
jgi:Flp pilus assembly pilin Flp